jgi:hypothetical protein
MRVGAGSEQNIGSKPSFTHASAASSRTQFHQTPRALAYFPHQLPDRQNPMEANEISRLWCALDGDKLLNLMLTYLSEFPRIGGKINRKKKNCGTPRRSLRTVEPKAN